jgi:hypothetical protein
MSPARSTSRQSNGGEGKEMHATVATTAGSPIHGYVERIHTPLRNTTHCKPTGDMTVDDWDDEKHAHFDDRASTPHGMVKREQTPLRSRSQTPVPSSVNGAVKPVPVLPVAPAAAKDDAVGHWAATAVFLGILAVMLR